MVSKNTRPTVADIRAMKARGQKISMLYVTTLEEAAAADAAGIDMLSIEGRFFTPEMREAAGRCFVQVGLPYGPAGNLVTAEDYLQSRLPLHAHRRRLLLLRRLARYPEGTLRQRRSDRRPCRADPFAMHLDRWVQGRRQDGRERACGLGSREAPGGHRLLRRRAGGGA